MTSVYTCEECGFQHENKRKFVLFQGEIMMCRLETACVQRKQEKIQMMNNEERPVPAGKVDDSVIKERARKAINAVEVKKSLTARVLAGLEKGQSNASIADELGVSESTVRTIKNDANRTAEERAVMGALLAHPRPVNTTHEIPLEPWAGTIFNHVRESDPGFDFDEINRMVQKHTGILLFDNEARLNYSKSTEREEETTDVTHLNPQSGEEDWFVKALIEDGVTDEEIFEAKEIGMPLESFRPNLVNDTVVEMVDSSQSHPHIHDEGTKRAVYASATRNLIVHGFPSEATVDAVNVHTGIKLTASDLGHDFDKADGLDAEADVRQVFEAMKKQHPNSTDIETLALATFRGIARDLASPHGPRVIQKALITITGVDVFDKKYRGTPVDVSALPGQSRMLAKKFKNQGFSDAEIGEKLEWSESQVRRALRYDDVDLIDVSSAYPTSVPEAIGDPGAYPTIMDADGKPHEVGDTQGVDAATAAEILANGQQEDEPEKIEITAEMLGAVTAGQFIEKALLTVANQFVLPQQGHLDAGEFYVVWFTKVLDNWTALVSTDAVTGLYWEVSYDGSQQKTHLDTFHKVSNLVVQDVVDDRGPSWLFSIDGAQILVASHFEVRPGDHLDPEDFIVSWSALAEGHWKVVLFSQHVEENMWEVTYNGHKNEAYIDTYHEVESISIPDSL